MPNGQTPEINYLMSLVEKKFRRQVKTSTDFYSLASEVESQTRMQRLGLNPEKNLGLCQDESDSQKKHT